MSSETRTASRAAFSAFWEGLTSPSALSVTIMLASLVLSAIALVVLPQQAMQSGNGWLFATDKHDYDTFITSELEHLADTPTEKPLVAIVGASVTHSSFGTIRELNEALDREMGEDVDVMQLSTGRMQLPTSLMIMDRLPRNRPVYVILGIGPSRFTTTLEDIQSTYETARFGTSSPAEEQLKTDLGIGSRSPTGYLMVDHGGFYITRLGSAARNSLMWALLGRRVQRDDERYVGRVADDDFFALRAEAVSSRFDNFEETHPLNVELLERVVTLARSRENMTLVLVEHPINPRFVSEYLGEERYAAHLADMRALTQRLDVPYWTLGLDLDLPRDSYFDWAHISSDTSQAMLREALAEHLGAIDDE